MVESVVNRLQMETWYSPASCQEAEQKVKGEDGEQETTARRLTHRCLRGLRRGRLADVPVRWCDAQAEPGRPPLDPADTGNGVGVGGVPRRRR